MGPSISILLLIENRIGFEYHLSSANGGTALHMYTDVTTPISEMLLANTELVKLNAKSLDFFKETPFSKGLNTFHIEKIQHLCDEQIVNIVNDQGFPPLYYCQSPSTIRFLLEKGANTNVKMKNGWTLLHEYAFQNSETTSDLLQYGALVNARDSAGVTPLIALFRQCHVGEVSCDNGVAYSECATLLEFGYCYFSISLIYAVLMSTCKIITMVLQHCINWRQYHFRTIRKLWIYC
jgi:hypothetical protein